MDLSQLCFRVQKPRFLNQYNNSFNSQLKQMMIYLLGGHDFSSTAFSSVSRLGEMSLFESTGSSHFLFVSVGV